MSPGLAAAFLSGQAEAGAWPLAPGRTQIIAKYESSQTRSAYDLDGRTIQIPPYAYSGGEVFIERGLSQRLTLQANLRYLRGQEGFGSDYTRITGDLGLRVLAYRSPSWVVSLYGGGAVLRSDQAQLSAQSRRDLGDPEARLLVGHNFSLGRNRGFAEIQAAQLGHKGKASEMRIEGRVGMDLTRSWQVLLHNYRGSNPRGVEWSKAELSLVRELGPASLQLGWRQSLSGRQTAHEAGPVLALWYRF